MRGLMMDSPLTLASLLTHTARLHGASEIVSRCDDKALHRYTYASCLERARRLGAALRALGLGSGDRVATFAWNNHRHLEAYLGVSASGFVLHTLNVRLHPDDLAYITTDASDRIAIVDQSLWPQFEKFRERAPFEHVIVLSDSGSVPEGTIDYETLIASHDAEPFADIVNENSASSMCYTSGTTGKPKGVVYSHRSLVLHAMAIALPDMFSMSRQDVVLPVVPMFHANAWGIPYAAAMVGAKLVLPGRFLDAQSVVELLASERTTLTAGVPTVWLGILDYLDAHPHEQDLSALRMMVIGGSAVPLSMVQAFEQRHGLTIMQGWGMTELSPLGSFTTNRPCDTTVEARQKYRATQGEPAPFVDIRARGESGFIPWDGETMGELEVRGPWVASAYHGHASDEVFTDDGWFRTGDVVTISAAGNIQIQDRNKDLVKSGGEWISSVLLENHLMGHPHVAEAAVIAVPHPQWLERPFAVVVPRANCSPDSEELRAFIGERFAKWWVPDSIAFTDALPRTATGKVRKLDLRQRYWGGSA